MGPWGFFPAGRSPRMRMALLATTLFAATAMAGCSDDDKTVDVGGVQVRSIAIHIGWNEDGQGQYMEPSSIRVKQGDKVQFVVTNDDDPAKDYNGNKSGKDNFHDVALLDYDGDGDGIKETIEHEVPAGQTETTSLKGKPYFVASEKGTFRIVCEVRTVPSHDALGMHAEFIVE
ncbi:MAG: hypothetical protein QOJ26_153 [Thermoplasmata archaeon]|nr:hypothetical protein [Thermoplasmata archaeon]